MSTKYKFHDPEGIYFISTSVVYWIDVFTRRLYKDILIESMQHCIEQKGLIIYAYVIMSNHLHMITGRQLTGSSFSEIMRDFKKFTAMQIIKAINENPQESRRKWLIWMMGRAGRDNINNTKYQFWQQDNHPIMLEGDWIDQKMEYLHQNPVEAGWVNEPWEYYYSSARNYASMESPMKITSVYDGIFI